MSKKSRKMKWKGVALNHSNIDEYMKDLIDSTSTQYITQGVSFNKDDNFQVTLLKNSILAHGSFSGFVKNLLFDYFEKNGSIDDSIWQPNTVTENEDEGSNQPSPSPTTPAVSNESDSEPNDNEDKSEDDNPSVEETETTEETTEENEVEEVNNNDEDNDEDGESEQKQEANTSITQQKPEPIKVAPKTIPKKITKRRSPSPNADAFLPK